MQIRMQPEPGIGLYFPVCPDLWFHHAPDSKAAFSLSVAIWKLIHKPLNFYDVPVRVLSPVMAPCTGPIAIQKPERGYTAI